jgi:hypothetical protein
MSHGRDAQQVCICCVLNIPRLGLISGNALTVKFEPTPEVGGIEHAASHRYKAVDLVESRLP